MCRCGAALRPGADDCWRFQRDSALYLTLARSLAETRTYSFDYRSHVLALPGLPGMSSLVYMTVGASYLAMNALMALFGLGCIAVACLVYRRLPLSPGAGGAIGVRFIAKSKPDGYTIGQLSGSPVVISPFFQEVDYDPTVDFTPIIQYADADHPLAVPADSPIKTFKDFIEEARKRQVTYASMEVSAVSIALTRMAAEAKIKLKLIPTGGTGQAVPMVLGGHTDAIAVSGVYEYVRSGKLRLICQTGGVRNKEFPDIPTLRELGYDAETVALFGIVAPKGLPEQIKRKLEETFTRAVHDPSLAQVVENAGFTLVYRNGEDFGKYIKEAYKNSEKQLRELGLGKFSKEKK